MRSLFFFNILSGFNIISLQSKFAGWWINGVDQLGDQNRSDYTQNSVTGQIFPGRAKQFSGSTKRAVVADDGAFDIGSNSAFSLSFWVYWDSFTGFSRLLGKIINASTAGEYYLSTGSSGAIFNIRGTGGVQSVTLIGSVTTGTWYHIIVTIDASQVIRCYVNDVAAGSNPTVSGSISSIATTHGFGINTTVSAVSGTGTGYAGTTRFRDLRIFKGKVLSSTERTDVYYGRWVSGATAWFPLCDSSATRLHNAVGTSGPHFVATDCTTTTGYFTSVYNDFGYAEDATYGQIPPNLSSSSPTVDCYGNALVFTGSAKQNLTISGSDNTMFADAASDQLNNLIDGCSLVSLNTWFNGSTAQTVSSPVAYCGMRQFSSPSKLIILKAGEYLTAQEELSICNYMSITNRAHSYHATSEALFSRFINPVSDRDKSLYDNAIRLVQGHWSKYESITNTAPFYDEMLFDWVNESNDLIPQGSRLAAVPYKGRAPQTNSWECGVVPSSSVKFLQNDCFISFKTSDNLVIPSGANNALMLSNGDNITAFWDYDSVYRQLRCQLNSASANSFPIPNSVNTNSVFTVIRTSSSSVTLVSDTTIQSNTTTSNTRSSNKVVVGLGWHQNYFQHFSIGQGLTQNEALLHNSVFDYFNTQMGVFSGEWVQESGFRYKLSDKVILDRIGDNIIWSDYANIYYSTDNGESVAASIGFDSIALGWIHMVHIFDNGEIIFATNKNKLYGTTTSLSSISEIIPTKNGITYTPHTPNSATNPGEYFKFIGPKHKQYLSDGTEIFVWNAYSVSLRGAAPTLVLYSLGNSAVKVAREFGQNPYIRDNGSSSGSTSGTLLGDSGVSSYVRHGHGVSQRKDDLNKFMAFYGDLDRALLAPALSAFYECKWEEGEYNKALDSWSWTQVVESPQNERFKSTFGFFTEDELWWTSDAAITVGNEAERGYFKAPLTDLPNKSTHTRFYNPIDSSSPSNMFFLDQNGDELFFMGGGYAANPAGGFFFNDPNIIYGDPNTQLHEVTLKIPGNVYIPIILKRSYKKYSLLVMTNYDYYRNAQTVDIEFD